MNQNMQDVFKDVLRLAEARDKAERKLGNYTLDTSKPEEFRSEMESPDNKEAIRAGVKLENYLYRLKYEEIITVYTVMYLGRDQDYDRYDSPKAIYNKQRKYIEDFGWSGLEYAASQIAGKSPLVKYLEDGLAILDIDITANR